MNGPQWTVTTTCPLCGSEATSLEVHDTVIPTSKVIWCSTGEVLVEEDGKIIKVYEFGKNLLEAGV